jgi:hypothetical protein
MKPKSATAKKATELAFAPATIKATDLEQYDLTMLMQLYRTLRRSIDDFGGLTAGGKHAESMFTLVDRRFVSLLDKSIDVCRAAIKARKPQGRNETEQRHALLYDHAINFDGSDEEKRVILAEAMLAIPVSDSIKLEVSASRKPNSGKVESSTKSKTATGSSGAATRRPRN